MDGAGSVGPRRRPTEGGYARGAETRDKIIEAAFVVFAEEGYGAASTRRIAAEAGVNPPALQYYFDSKEGLHRACGQAIVDRVNAQLDGVMTQGRGALTASDPRQAADALCELLAAVADLAMAKIETDAWSRFMNRCQSDDIGPAFEVIQQKVAKPLKGLVVELMAKARGESRDDPQLRLRALLMMSQISAFHHMREDTLEVVGWGDFAGANAEAVKAVLKDHVRRLAGQA